MATRYWVGGSGTWDATTTTNWSTASNGSAGASAPTSADDVVFDAFSGAAPTVTIGTNAVCGAVTITAPTSGTLTFAFSTTGVISYNGNWSSPASLFATTGPGGNSSATGAICYVGSGSSTLTTNGYSFPTSFGVNTSTGTLTLGGALTTTSNFNINQGTFSTSASNYALTTINFNSSNSNIRTINLNGSTVTVGGSITFTTTTNLTFNAGTSTLIMSSSVSFAGSGLTYYTVNFTSTVLSPSISGLNTFTNLSFTGSTTSVCTITLAANQTITGTLTLGNSNTAVKRIFVASSVIGTSRTLTVGTLATLTDVDFRDITAAGASASTPWSGTRLGNCGGNSNITFDASKTVYWNLSGAQNWSATGWATSSGGTPAVNNFPLAQDTAVFDNTGSVTGAITISGPYNIGTIDMSLRTTAMTLTINIYAINIYGSWKNGTGTTITGSASVSITFAGQSTTQQITSNSVSFANAIIIDNATGTVQLVDDFTTATTITTTLTSGTLDLNGKKLSTGLFSSNNSNTRTIAFGIGNITVTGTGVVYSGAAQTNLTVTGTPVVNVTSTGSTAISINASSSSVTEANSISFNFTGGTYPLSFNTFAARSLDFTGYAGTLTLTFSGTIYGNLKLSTGMSLASTTGTLTFGATSGTQQITSNAKTIDQPITVNGVGGTVQLQDAMTLGATRTFTLTNGTLNLNNLTLTTGLFSSSNSNTRTIAFGAGNIECTGTGTVWSTATVTGLTVTGTPVVNVTSSGSTAITVSAGVLSEANSISYNFTGGTYTLSFLGSSATAKNVDFTGFAGYWGTVGSPVTVYGNFKLSTGMTVTGSIGNPLIFGATSGTQTFTSNAKTMDMPITINGGATFSCADALTLGSTRALTFSLGTLQLAASTTSTVGSFVTSGTTLKYLQSTTSGTQATLSDASGTNTVTYLSIKDINVTGGATWVASAASNINVGNNTGWSSIVALGKIYGSRITSTGILYTPISAYFDEVTLTKSSITPTVTYSSTFDEVTLQGQNVAKRETSTGQIQVSGYLDEVTGIS